MTKIQKPTFENHSSDLGHIGRDYNGNATMKTQKISNTC